MAIESIPDSGVEIRKAVIAPLFAPFFFKSVAAGNTPQDQRGRGTPKKAAFKTEENLPAPKWLIMKAGLSTTLSMPAIRMPKRIYTEESSKMLQDSLKMPSIRLIIVFSYMNKTDIGEHLDMIIHQTIVEDRSFPSVFNEFCCPKKPQLMAHRRFRNSQEGGNIADAHLLVFQGKKDPQAAWIRQYLKHI